MADTRLPELVRPWLVARAPLCTAAISVERYPITVDDDSSPIRQ